MLAHACKDPDFSSVRGASLDALPEAESAPWRAVWSTIEQALNSKDR